MIHMMIGLQASGKSTYVEKHAPKSAVIVSPDRIRQEIYHVVFDPAVEEGVWYHFFRQIEEALKNGKEVYIDNTNVTREGRAMIFRLAKQYNVPVIGYWFHTPLEVCLKRNRERERVVPEYMIHDFYHMFVEPTMEEGFKEIKHIYYKEKSLKRAEKARHEKKGDGPSGRTRNKKGKKG